MITARMVKALSFTAALALAGTASAQSVDINGGNSWTGWNSVGNSQTSGMWVKGSTTRTYDIYRTSFILGAGQTVGGNRLVNGTAGNGVDYTGEDSASLFSGSWQAGDRILGMGVQYTGSTRGTTFFFRHDAGGNNVFAASSFGAGDGLSSHSAGDITAYMTTMPGNPRGQVRHYEVTLSDRADGVAPPGTSIVPYPVGGFSMPNPAMPTRSFAVLDSGSQSIMKSAQYFINIDAILRSNGGLTYGEGDFGPNSTFGFWEGNQGSGWDGTQFTQQTFAIPAPGAMALIGLAGLAGARRRR
jgi:hypothetical protein